MKGLLIHIYYCIVLWRIGYSFSGNIHNHVSNKTWGFIRLNHGDVYSIIDIDFDMYKKIYSHIHGDAQGQIFLYPEYKDIKIKNATIYKVIS